MTRWTCLLSLLVCASLAGCASSAGTQLQARALSSASPSGSSVSPAGSTNANRDKARTEARRLLGLAVIPPGAVALAKAPTALPLPALGLPSETTYVDLSSFYRVPLPYQATLAYARAHPPAGSIDGGSSGGTMYPSAGLAWEIADAGDPQSVGQLSVVMAAADATSTYFRVDAGMDWSDPRPVRDSTAGPRLRIDGGQPCPASDARAVGVRSAGADLSRMFAPSATATGGLVCSYAGGNGHPMFALLRSRKLTAAQAGRLGTLAHQVDLSHPDGGWRSCPMDGDSVAVLVLDYPGRPAVDSWLHERGCAFLSNGQVVAGGSASMQALLDAVQVFEK